ITQETDTNYYDFDNRIVTSAAGIVRKVGIHRDPGSKKVLLWGSIPLGDKGMKAALSIDDPAEYTAQLFRQILEQHGITVTGKAQARHGDIAQFFDQPLPSAQLSSAPGQTPAAQTPAPQAPPPTVLAEHISLPLIEDVRVTNKTSQNLHAEMDLRLAAKLDGMLPSFEGGAAVVQLLLYASHQPWGAAYQESLPVSGVDGSLAERFLNTPAGGLIHAKTG